MFLKKIFSLFANMGKIPSQDYSEHSESSKKNGELKILKEDEGQLLSKTRIEERDIVVGFDLGTSFTKVVIRDVALKISYAVPFDRISDEQNKYLLPTKLYYSNNRTFSLSSIDNQITDDIKIPLMELKDVLSTDEISTSLTHTVAYIGLVLSEARKWFLVNKKSIYKKINLNWHLNIGIPARNYDDTVLKNNFRISALGGWNLSGYKGDITKEVCKKTIIYARSLAKNNNHKPPTNLYLDKIDYEKVDVFPEIIAEFLGYAKSSMRRDGLHLLIDIGALTIDIAIFNLLQREGEDHYPIFTAEVKKLGAIMLHKARLGSLPDDICEGIIKKCNLEDFFSIIRNPYNFISKSYHESVRKAEEEHLKKCSCLITRAVAYTKKMRVPKDDAWKKGASLFLCGGGSILNCYKKALRDAENVLNPMGINKFNLNNLPTPDDIEASELSLNEFHRLGVAYGLSFHKFDIGGIVPPSKIPDLLPHRPKRDIDKLYTDKDQV